MNQSLVNSPPPKWYQVADWALAPGSSNWLAWDVILGLWVSGDLLLAPKVKSTITTRCKRSPYRVLYVYLNSNQMPFTKRQEIDSEAQDVIILYSLGRHGLAPHLPDQRPLWAIHYNIMVATDGAWRPASVEMRSPLGVPHCIQPSRPSSMRLPKAPVRSSRTCRWHWMDPPHGPIYVRDHVLELTRPDRFGTARSRARLRSLSGDVVSRG